MFKQILILLSILLISSSLCFNMQDFSGFLKKSRNNPSNHFAVLVAGSNGYWNYRHQSDIFHAYHILIKNGIPANNIIVFAYDDVANNSQNPFPGKVYNHPDPKGKGVDVYEGVVIDYKGKDVTPEIFLDVIQGNEVKVGSQRVLESKENDNVFIYFADHGAPGLIAFPVTYLYADNLIAALKNMNSNKKYKKLVFYIEACESGSMFANLPEDINIYATTAANDRESSYAAYCGSEAKVNNKNLGSCLGDEYSVNWMEDSDLHTEGETLLDQFTLVKQKTKGSHVQHFGSHDIEKELIIDYQGVNDEINRSYNNSEIKERNKILDSYKNNLIDSREVKLHYLYEQARTKNDLESNVALNAEIHFMEVTDEIFRRFDNKLDISVSEYFSDEKRREVDFTCLRFNLELYKQKCNNFDEYTLKYVKNIVLACNKYSIDKVADAVFHACDY